jgi:hypothetical protein
MKKEKSITFMLCSLFIFTSISIGFAPTVLASGKSIYGTLYIDGVIADPGVTITFMINGTIVDQTVTVEWDEDNYILGFSSVYEGETGYFYVGEDELIPYDNASVLIGMWIGKRMDLHVGEDTDDEDVNADGDMNDDGLVNSADVRYLALNIVGDPAYDPLYSPGDVNSDGLINSADVRYLALFLVGDPAYTPLYP